MTIPWWGIIPFVVMLLSIAILPLVPATAKLWDRPRNQLIWALILGLPVAVWFLVGGEGTTVFHTVVEYVQFIMLLFALFVVSGGIYLRGDLAAKPATNTAFLAIGGTLASFIGTTGAAMLLIRPILNTNRERKYRAHTVVFTILVVANCGGLLTPLGDPPLFLGFLRGVPFSWTFGLLPYWLFVNAALLVTYFLLDTKKYKMEPAANNALDNTQREPLSIEGKLNFVWFLCVIVGVATVPSINLAAIDAGTAGFVDWMPWRELLFAGAALGSMLTTSREIRYERNEYEWAPIAEVGAIFIGIFLTMMPALRYLAQVAPTLPLNKMTFFYFTGGLSAVLDNAPTYVTFFEMAKEIPAPAGDLLVAGVPESFLISISLGSVFFGAVTYIGNGPNFMVKSVAESAGVPMPSFGGYMVWTFRYLIPLLIALSMIFILDGMVWMVVGIVILAASVAGARIGTPPSAETATAKAVTTE